MNHEKLYKLVDRFKELPILVIGDVMLDKVIRGKVSRISPEAPVPVVEVASESQTPGGAGNVSANIAALGGKAILASVIGNDSDGDILLDELRNRNINIAGLIKDSTRPTITKTRIIAEHQQVVRVDRENKDHLDPKIRARLLEYVNHMLPQVSGLILSDYGKGVIGQPQLNQVLTMARQYKKKTVVDPKVEHFLSYKGVDCITPNLKEATEGMHMLPPKNDGELNALAQRIIKKLGCRSLLITRGEHGMSLFERQQQPKHIPTMALEVFDVTGAGDTVVSVFTMTLGTGADFHTAAVLANYAAGVVVGKLGTATVSSEELKKALKRNKTVY